MGADLGQKAPKENRKPPKKEECSEGWMTVSDHHRTLWQNAFSVECRDLSVYEEVARCN